MMSKRTIGCIIAAALLGGGLIWAADHRAEDGIAGWETLNAGMAQALGVAEDEALPAGTGKEGANVEGGAGSGSTGAAAGGEAGAVSGSFGAAAGGSVGGAGGNVEGGAGSAGTGTGGGSGGESGGTAGTPDHVAGSGAMPGSAGSVGSGGAGAAGGTVASGEAVGAAGSGGGASGTVGPLGAGAAATSAAPAVAADGRINVNAADAAVLMDLPGIGEKKAQAIIDYRSSKGAFRSLSDLGKVKGIGPKLLEQLKPLVAF